MPTPSPGDPDRVGPYRLMARIGEGGMGVVHLAADPDGHRVALKVLRPHVVGDAEARERLAREVGSLGRVTSPRVAEILDADPHGPTPYVVTRYVPGLSLHHHVAEEGPIGGRDLVHLADSLAEALEAVHAVGVLHRDVKPTNVVMEGRSPVLIDFGLARVSDDPRLTQTGFLLGTPGYLAPEILYGDDASAASDVHAWAATVAFAATGRPPYGRGPTMAVMDRVRRGQHDLSGVPDELAELLRDCLDPESWQRPTLGEVRERLARVRRSEAATVAGAREQWTMPVRALTPLGSEGLRTPRTRIAPLHAPTPPAQRSAPPEPAVEPASPSARTVFEVGYPPPPRTQVLPPPAPAARAPRPPADPTRVQRALQLLGLGALAAALVAYAPYAGTALVGLCVLVLRTVSVTRQRHTRRRLLRGRRRWYDVPATVLALPFYVVTALVGSLMAMAVAAFVGLAMFSLGYVLGQGLATSLVLAGLGLVPALWWGPGAGRVRETARALTRRTARTDYGGWFVVGMSVVGVVLLVTLLLGSGPSWAPALTAPWHGAF